MSTIVSCNGETKDVAKETRPKRKAFATWEVGGETYRLKLNTATICQLEEKFKTNLMNLLGSDDDIPALSNMLYITHAAMKNYHHGIKLEDVKTMYDTYLSEGGSLITFFMDVFMPIYQVSGFFTESVESNMERQMKQAKEQIL